MKIAAAFYTVLRAYWMNEPEIPKLNRRILFRENFFEIRSFFDLNILRISIVPISCFFSKAGIQKPYKLTKNVKC